MFAYAHQRGPRPSGSRPGVVLVVTGFGSRSNACLGGLFFTAISLAFVAAGFWMTFGSIYRAETYRPVAAVVEKVQGTDPAADRTTVTYAYVVSGERFTGSESADEDSKKQFQELRQYKTGRQLTVYYNPHDPARSQMSITPQSAGLAFATFALPFLAIGLSSLWKGLTGRDLVKSTSVGGGDPLPGGAMFVVFIGTCVAGTAAQVALSTVLPWPWNLIACLAVLLVAIPGGNIYLSRLLSRRRVRKAAAWRPLHERATTAAGDQGLEAGQELDTEPAAMTIRSPRRKLAILVGVTIFWCGITGVLAWFAIGSLVMQRYAELHYQQTGGTVLASRVKTHAGSEGTTVSAQVKYRYFVQGQEYIGDRYDFLGGSSSDRSYAYRIVYENPPSKSVIVYYDPSRPAKAVLTLAAPASSYFLLLFLQPFVLVGLALIGWCCALPRTQRRLRRFLEGRPGPAWSIPGWGVMEQDHDGVVIQSRPNRLAPLGNLILGYGIACFASIFVVGFFFHGFGDANPAAIRWAFIAAAAVGVLAMLRKLWLAGSPSRVEIDNLRKLLRVRSRKRDVEMPLAELHSLRLRKVRYPAGLLVNGQSVRYLLLEAVTVGEPVPLHAFPWRAGQEDDVLAVARKVQQALADGLGVTATRTIATEAQAPEFAEAPKSPSGALKLAVAALRRSRRSAGYSDLC